MDRPRTLFFGANKVCPGCGKMLPDNYEEEYCAPCAEQNLFKEVREYIRENDVTERDVCREFGLSKWKVREWIKNGRIEYVEDNGHQFAHPVLTPDEEYKSKVKGFIAANRDEDSKWRTDIP